MAKTLEERLWEKIRKAGPDDCWEWTAKSRSGSALGYGTIRVAGRLIGAHRLVWELTNGPIPDDLCVLHECDNPPCCNPTHLHLGTRADNMAEKVARGRAATWRNGPWKKCRKGHPKRPDGRCTTCAREARLKWMAENPHYYRDRNRRLRAKGEE